eukprot:Platyproteum_vivax@DN7297_c1_g1_i1.p1
MIRYILVIVGVLGCLAVRDRHGLSTANYKFPQTGIRTLRIRTGLKETPELLIDNLSDADLDFLKEQLPKSEFQKAYNSKKKGPEFEFKNDKLSEARSKKVISASAEIDLYERKLKVFQEAYKLNPARGV